MFHNRSPLHSIRPQNKAWWREATLSLPPSGTSPGFHRSGILGLKRTRLVSAQQDCPRSRQMARVGAKWLE